VFHCQDARGKAVLGIAGQDGQPGLAEDGAGIKVGGDFVDGAARFAVPRGKGAGVGVQAGVFRQERGMDVQHPALVATDEAGGQDAHETGEADYVGPGGVDLAGKVGLESLAVGIGAVVEGGGGDAQSGGFRKPPGGGVVRGDEDGTGGMVPRHVTHQRQHVRATPGNQDGDTLHSKRPR
jgi:hypothetical protein